MQQLIFATSNEEKLLTAQHVCQTYDIEIAQRVLDVPEIQSEDPEIVAIDKAQKAYAALGEPVIITDDSWSFAGLKGFPGVYMHSMNNWLSPEDFLRLTLPLHDRRATLTQYLIYADQTGQKVFRHQTPGTLLKEIRGQSKHSNLTIISLEGDHGQSIAEVYAQAADKSSHASGVVWHEFAKWFSDC